MNPEPISPIFSRSMSIQPSPLPDHCQRMLWSRPSPRTIAPQALKSQVRVRRGDCQHCLEARLRPRQGITLSVYAHRQDDAIGAGCQRSDDMSSFLWTAALMQSGSAIAAIAAPETRGRLHTCPRPPGRGNSLTRACSGEGRPTTNSCHRSRWRPSTSHCGRIAVIIWPPRTPRAQPGQCADRVLMRPADHRLQVWTGLVSGAIALARPWLEAASGWSP
jgi:hypothetical protein